MVPTTEDKQRIIGIIRELDQMSQVDKNVYADLMKNHPAVAELIGNIALLSDDGRTLFRTCANHMQHGNAAKVAELLRT